jgi:MFS family permease
MSIGMLFAGLAVGLVVKPRMEKPLLVWMPALGAACIAAFPWVTGLDAPIGGVPMAFAFSILAGIGYAGVVPITISMAQRLLPHRTSLASGLMMGGAWSIAAIGPALAQQLYLRAGLTWSFVAVGGLLLVAVVLGAMVRHPDDPRH